jgi:cell division septation protein DedD
MTFVPDREDRLWRESAREGRFRISTPLWYAIFVTLLVVLLIGLWYLFVPMRQGVDKVEIPLIRADETAYKIKAEDQGVPSVKHQDKLVYGRIRGDKNEALVEHILPDPEPPEALETLKMVEQYQPDDLEVEKVIESEDSSPKPEETVSSLIASIEDLIEEEPPGQKQVSKKQSPEKQSAKGTVFIQLGSLKSHDLAESEWDRLSKKHKDIFGNLKPMIQKVDLGEEQGIYHRLRTGPFDTSEKAATACASLKERKVECLVIR